MQTNKKKAIIFNPINLNSVEDWFTECERLIIKDKISKNYEPFLIIESLSKQVEIWNRVTKCHKLYNKEFEASNVIKSVYENNGDISRTIFFCHKSEVSFLQKKLFVEINKDIIRSNGDITCVCLVQSDLTLQPIISYKVQPEAKYKMEKGVIYNPELLKEYVFFNSEIDEILAHYNLENKTNETPDMIKSRVIERKEKKILTPEEKAERDEQRKQAYEARKLEREKFTEERRRAREEKQKAEEEQIRLEKEKRKEELRMKREEKRVHNDNPKKEPRTRLTEEQKKEQNKKYQQKYYYKKKAEEEARIEAMTPEEKAEYYAQKKAKTKVKTEKAKVKLQQTIANMTPEEKAEYDKKQKEKWRKDYQRRRANLEARYAEMTPEEVEVCEKERRKKLNAYYKERRERIKQQKMEEQTKNIEQEK